MIGIVAVVVTGLCAGGLLLFKLFPPAGQHRLRSGRHRDNGEVHRGYADDDAAVAQLAELAEDAPPTGS